MTTQCFKIFMVAGEPSSDSLASSIIQALDKHSDMTQGLKTNIKYAGIGGEQMKHLGFHSIFPQSDLALIGFFEIVPRLFKIFWRLYQTLRYIKTWKPDAIITIDTQDFSLLLMRLLWGYHGKKIHVVAPTVWAWRSGRIKAIKRHYDHQFLMFRFEQDIFKSHGVSSSFVGHPVLGEYTKYRSLLNHDHVRKSLLLLPGSRKREIQSLLPVFLEGAYRFKKKHPDVPVRMLTLPKTRLWIKDLLHQPTYALWADGIEWVEGIEQKWAAFADARAALAASGTVTMELALADVPMVVAYRVHPWTYKLGRYIIRGVRFMNMANIIQDRMGHIDDPQDPPIPELIQNQCHADRVLQHLEQIWDDQVARDRQHQALADLRFHLGASDSETDDATQSLPAEKMAEQILKMILVRSHSS